MTVRRALVAAARDLYANSWRLLIVNTVASAVGVGVVTLAVFAPPALVLLPLAGPFVAALAHACVVQASGEDATLREAARALRLHVRRGLGLGVLATGVVALAEHAIGFYATHGAWPVAILGGELLAVFALHQLVLWTLAVAAPQTPVRDLSVAAVQVLVRRPGRALGLALALLVVGALLGAAGVLPLLMLGGAYAFLAAARVALPEPAPSTEAAWQA